MRDLNLRKPSELDIVEIDKLREYITVDEDGNLVRVTKEEVALRSWAR